MRVLIVNAVSVERDAVMRGLRNNKGFEIIISGVGPVAAAAVTAKALAVADYDLVVSAGIGGGFPGVAGVGSLVIASDIVAADLGVETPEGFDSLEELGFGSTRIRVDANLSDKVTEAMVSAGLQVYNGPVLTMSTVTGTAESAGKLAARVRGAAAEAMEGYGVAVAANNQGVPVLEIRAVSNLVGPRDRAAWCIEEALEVLEKAAAVLSEVLL